MYSTIIMVIYDIVCVCGVCLLCRCWGPKMVRMRRIPLIHRFLRRCRQCGLKSCRPCGLKNCRPCGLKSCRQWPQERLRQPRADSLRIAKIPIG